MNLGETFQRKLENSFRKSTENTVKGWEGYGKSDARSLLNLNYILNVIRKILIIVIYK